MNRELKDLMKTLIKVMGIILMFFIFFLSLYFAPAGWVGYILLFWGIVLLIGLAKIYKIKDKILPWFVNSFAGNKVKIVIFIVICLFILTTLYPPYCVQFETRHRKVRSTRWDFLFSPPNLVGWQVEIDYKTLALEYFLIILFGSGLALLFYKKPT